MIQLYGLDRLHNRQFQEKVLARWKNILEENSFVEGRFNLEFEKEFARIQNASFSLLVANGTDALEIAMCALGVKKGDNVAVPQMTFYATAEAVVNIGANPVFIDVSPQTGLMDAQSLQRMSLSLPIKAVIPVHLYGLNVPMNEIESVCNRQGITILEDAAQGFGGTYEDGRPIGSRHTAAFSFYPTKNLGAFGDAGAITSHDEKVMKQVGHIRNHGRGSGESVAGRNSRCDHLQAAVLSLKLEEASRHHQMRKKAALKYHQAFRGSSVQVVPEKFMETSSWHLYPIRFPSVSLRSKVQKALSAKGIGSSPFYEKALSWMPAFSDFPGEDGQVREICGRVLCLPMHPYLKDEEMEKVTRGVLQEL